MDVPVGVILCYKGGTPAETWMSEKTLKDKGFENVFAWYERKIPENYEAVYQKFLTDNKAYKDAQKRGEKPQGDQPREPDGWRNPKRPVGLYELMLKPLMPYTVKGFIWYQGEANASRAKEYQSLFPALIEEWRDDFKVN